MTEPNAPTIIIVAQSGRLTYEAVLFAASLRAAAPDFKGRLVVAEPSPGALWPRDPGIDDFAARELLERLGADVRQFTSRQFGASYPIGNKVECLSALEPDEPFIYFDTDTIITGPIDRMRVDYARPTASMARTASWPKPQLYGPGYNGIWSAIYRRFGIPFEPTLDLSQPDEHWERYMYFNAGWFLSDRPHDLRDKLIGIMCSLRDDPMQELASQALYPWLDQIALPVAIAAMGGGRPSPELDGLDGDISWHWRALPLLYAKATDAQLAFFHEITAPNRIKKVLKNYEPFKRMIYHNRGAKVRALFDPTNLPPRETTLRARIKKEKLWMR